MRTTVNLDQSTYETASLYANARSITLGEAIGELISKSQDPVAPSRIMKDATGFPVLTPGGSKVTSEMVKDLEQEELGG
jgi:hypothetical protein